ncbi:hypothetical protein T484DRAFT_1957242 [Baffinella frigidus]|nr:hypothetical protein T484DRAFT_1957242 [Cryptophyta sp. CCMP2293]
MTFATLRCVALLLAAPLSALAFAPAVAVLASSRRLASLRPHPTYFLCSDRPRDATPGGKDGAATETLKREFSDVVSTSKALPGFLRGAMDRYSLKRVATETRGEHSLGEWGVPTSTEEVMEQAKEDLVTAVASEEKRLRIDLLVPGQNEAIEDRFPFDEAELIALAFQLVEPLAPLRVCLMFDSAGTTATAAAFCQRTLGAVPRHVTLESTSSTRVIRDKLRGDEASDVTQGVSSGNAIDVYVVVRPKNNRGDSVILAVEQAVAKAPEAAWVLLNPLLEDQVDAYTFGIVEMGRRREFMKLFDTAYCFRGLFKIARPSLIPSEKGAVLRRFAQPWRVLKLNKEGYEMMLESESKPDRSDISAVFF